MSENEQQQQQRPLVGVIDASTRTVKFGVFVSQHIKELAEHAIDLEPITPKEGWSEQDPLKILEAVKICMEKVVAGLGPVKANNIITIGITNQRETTIVWDKTTGKPLYNALVWNDIRTDSTVDIILAKIPENNKNHFKPVCGLPISPYFSAFKLKWLMHHVPAVKKAIKEKKCLFGTVDTWLLWNLTGGPKGGKHLTDVTNASRTFLMNIETLYWDAQLLSTFKIPVNILPEIRSSSEIYGAIGDMWPLKGVTISGILGNQQSALLGQSCFKEGMAKNTYRSGCFLLYNTGNNRVQSSHGLVTTVAYKLGDQAPIYALEGSVAIAGAAMKWLRDNMGFMKDISKETESLAKEVFSTGDVYFVPAFKGLYAPYWRKDARGIICGLTAFSTKQHIIRAALEAVCFQTRDILEAMNKDCGIPLEKLHVDGVMTTNNLLMQLQADISGVPVIRAQSQDVTALGAAMAAGMARGVDVWDIYAEERELVPSDTFLPTSTEDERDTRYTKWKMAVQRSLGWVSPKKSAVMTEERYQLLSSIPGSLYAILSFGLLVLSQYLDN
ncbi:glycerol kinase [Anthonomus grandis grandis]|uniref:glycerol kinase n=1 Tax=Anthonomus grandis grandis TaxID=2921223 RepID=UPI002165D14F|nr:glycerol kinase [Anthonomus grandis grandis]XP_050312359.1 glycerol kinase [Anthonomus grandis grandis]XP_050312360.1 glycerol kinase [Anthonomus grandis grandis]